MQKYKELEHWTLRWSQKWNKRQVDFLTCIFCKFALANLIPSQYPHLIHTLANQIRCAEICFYGAVPYSGASVWMTRNWTRTNKKAIYMERQMPTETKTNRQTEKATRRHRDKAINRWISKQTNRELNFVEGHEKERRNKTRKTSYKISSLMSGIIIC